MHGLVSMGGTGEGYYYFCLHPFLLMMMMMMMMNLVFIPREARDLR